MNWPNLLDYTLISLPVRSEDLISGWCLAQVCLHPQTDVITEEHVCVCARVCALSLKLNGNAESWVQFYVLWTLCFVFLNFVSSASARTRSRVQSGFLCASSHETSLNHSIRRRYCLFVLYACLWFNSLYCFSTLHPPFDSCVLHLHLHPKPPPCPPSSFNLTLISLIPRPCNPVPPPSPHSSFVDLLCVFYPPSTHPPHPPTHHHFSIVTAHCNHPAGRGKTLTDNIKLALSAYVTWFGRLIRRDNTNLIVVDH